MALFDRYLIVDWSAARAPKTGKDSIWIALSDGTELQWVNNVPTRIEAMAVVRGEFSRALEDEKRIFAGFDFGFGYPRQFAERLKGNWEAVWKKISEHVTDNDGNVSNRFDAANEINSNVFNSKSGPFWRQPKNCRYSRLPNRKPIFDSFDSEVIPIAERRICEACFPRAKSQWELLNPGSVGSQTLLGIKHLNDIRTDRDLGSKVSFWPFSTEFDAKLRDNPIVIGEIYPSGFSVIKELEDDCIDESQVKTLASGFARLDQTDRFDRLLASPTDLPAQFRQVALEKEGWIVGASSDYLLLKHAINDEF